jgi:hypothetical protein
VGDINGDSTVYEYFTEARTVQCSKVISATFKTKHRDCKSCSRGWRVHHHQTEIQVINNRADSSVIINVSLLTVVIVIGVVVIIR